MGAGSRIAAPTVVRRLMPRHCSQRSKANRMRGEGPVSVREAVIQWCDPRALFTEACRRAGLLWTDWRPPSANLRFFPRGAAPGRR